MKKKVLLLAMLLLICMLSGCVIGRGGSVSTAPPTTPATEAPPTTTPVPTTEAPTTTPPPTTQAPPVEIDPPTAHGLVEWQSYDDAMENLMDNRKPVLMYLWGVDCQFCEDMDENTFSDPEVANYINENFNPIEVNISTSKAISQLNSTISGTYFAQLYQVTGVPAYTFINYEQEVRLPLQGYLDSEEMMIFLTYIAEEAYRDMSLSDYIKQVRGQD